MDFDSAVLYTNDIDKIRKFYEEVVGLKFDYQDAEHYVSFIFPNGAKLGINKPFSHLAHRDKVGHQTFFISVDDIEKEANKYKELGYEFFEPLEHYDWVSFFAVLDPDGNKIGYIKRSSGN